MSAAEPPELLLSRHVAGLAGHIDFFPTLAELAGAQPTDEIRAQVEGRSLVPLLQDPKAAWADRKLFTHVGRWPQGAAPADHKYARCSVRSARWHLVCDAKSGQRRWELFDVPADPGEKTDVAAQNPRVVADLEAAYDRWWDSVQPQLVNEKAVSSKVNPFKELYWKQYRGPGPNNVPREEFKKFGIDVEAK